MSIVFTIYYHAETGSIVSYQEGGLIPPAHETPKDCKALSLGGNISIWDDKGFINMKVDPATLHLIPINPPAILTVNPPTAENPIAANADPNAVIARKE